MLWRCLSTGVFRANAGHYGVHANDNSPGSHSSGAIYIPPASIPLNSGTKFQQNSSTDTSSYQFWWQPPMGYYLHHRPESDLLRS